MAKANSQRFSLLFLGFYLILIMSMTSEGVNAAITCEIHKLTGIKGTADLLNPCWSFCQEKYKTYLVSVKRIFHVPTITCECCHNPCDIAGLLDKDGKFISCYT
ncbi:hypothetical protein MKW94_000605 [Papaver nudicaule]|uniref:Uncharacterized protein n=1 Tax=Papaver nudicaule TaxID=74823 RepID=A0AA41RUW7_PAPNU|nr:hypothetical protein [Papaver nudicaule]